MQTEFEFPDKLLPKRRWPRIQDFPLNIDRKETVEKILLEDIGSSSSYTIITGFTSLSYLIDRFGNDENPKLKKVKILLGFEPNVVGRKTYHTKPLDRQIKDYWLERNVSILKCGSIINLIEKIKRNEVEFRFKDKQHAKIYVGDNYAILGSSNFSANGLKIRDEANIRISKSEDEIEKYNSIVQIAQNFYNDAEDYTKIIELLELIVKQVTWQEALARGIAEVLQNSQISKYKQLLSSLEKTTLWPTQWSALNQAMSILQEYSNVLIADPTGSGKTKLCSTVILCLKQWLWETGRGQKGSTSIVCPPLVIDKWKKEFRELSQTSNDQLSMGILSSRSKNNKIAIEDLKVANVLAIDEAHNFLNPNTNRTDAIRSNNAEFKILMTATPINRKVGDLLKMIELLDLDNLDDDSFKIYEQLLRKPSLKSVTQIQSLKEFISKFTVRRTKIQINAQITKDTESYKNKLGNICKFPTQITKTYDTLESVRDIDIANQITNLALQLKGAIYLNSIQKPKYEFSGEENIQRYIDNRINIARALSFYNVRSCLRSSKIALYEHIEGTEKAYSKFDLPGKWKKPNKHKIAALSALLEKDTKPRISKVFNSADIPDWLTTTTLFQEVCKKDRKLYAEIAKLTLQLSSNRDNAKVDLLATLLSNHNKIVAFDSKVITIKYYQLLFQNKYPKLKIIAAAGGDKRNAQNVIEEFELTSTNNEKTVALCSDMMSEGVDLQKASATVLLDIPSVIRIVEQRLGRVDRMDSPFDQISIYWPNDHDIFSLKGDKKLAELVNLVEATIGSNFELPQAMSDRHFQNTDSVESMQNEIYDYILQDKTWDGIQNSFQPIIDLKEGPNAIIKEKEYLQFEDVRAQVKTGVSFVSSQSNWCFISIRGTSQKSPRWVLIEKEDEPIIHKEFHKICHRLRDLTKKVDDSTEWNEKLLADYVKILSKIEFKLLSPKKQRALSVAEQLLKQTLKSRKLDADYKSITTDLLEIFQNKEQSLDYDAFAKMWIEILTPHLRRRKEQNRIRKRVFNLNSLLNRNFSKTIKFTSDELTSLLENCPITDNINKKIASCIIGTNNR